MIIICFASYYNKFKVSFQQPSWTLRAHVVCQFTDGVYIVNRTLPRSLHDVGRSTFSFIPVNDCVGMGPSELLSPGAYYAIKTALGRRSMKVSLENECLAVLGQRWKTLRCLYSESYIATIFTRRWE
jgi:hypothetical protein